MGALEIGDPGYPGYPTWFFFEAGSWAPYLMVVVVTAALAGAAWLAIRYKLAVIVGFIVLPVCLTIFWWPYSTAGTNSAGWFPIVKQYSALIGSLSLVALQYFPQLREKKWYLCIPPVILAVNILEAVIRDFQCFSIHGVDPSQGMVTWGGPWNLMNATAGILNILMISGWLGIKVSAGADRRIIWGDLTIPWIIAYDLWNFAYVYNCLADRAWYSGLALLVSCTIPAFFAFGRGAWYSGLALLVSCTIPAFFAFGRGAWIQYRAYTLTFWSGIVLTFPHFMQDSMFALRSAHNPTALWLVSGLALVVNIVVFIWHLNRIWQTRRNPFREEVYG